MKKANATGNPLGRVKLRKSHISTFRQKRSDPRATITHASKTFEKLNYTIVKELKRMKKKREREKKNNRYTVDTEFQTSLLPSLTLSIQREDQREIRDNH